MSGQISGVVVISNSTYVQDCVLASGAGVGVIPQILPDVGGLVSRWREARIIIIGEDLAAASAEHGLPPRAGVYLVGRDADELTRWSMPLEATVIHLPQGQAWLGSVLASGPAGSRAPVLAVVGGSGGIGASTLAAGVAHRAARRGHPVALIDVDRAGGGIDLVLGAERMPGWRWPKLASADGQVGDLTPYLPSVDGVTVVSMGRGSSLDVAREPLAAVVGSLQRHFELVVIDPGRALGVGLRESCRVASGRLLLVSHHLRSVAAARQLTQALDVDGFDLAVRHGKGGSVPAEAVEESLGFRLVAEVPHDDRLVTAAERGEPPARIARRPFTRVCDRLLSRYLGGGAGE